MSASLVIADGLAFPEGPVELSDGSVAIVQMAADLITVLDVGGNRRDLPGPGGPNGLALDPCGESVTVCLNGGLSFARDDNGGLMPGIAEDAAARGGLARVDLLSGRIDPLIGCGPASPVSGPNDV